VAAQATASRSVTPLHGLNLVAIVFRMMGARERLLAKQAAEDFLANELRPNTLVGVFSLDYKLNALQQFTNNTDLLKKAVKIAVSGAYREFAETSAAVLTASEFAVNSGPGGVTVAGGEVDVNRPVGATVPADTSNAASVTIMRGILAKERRMFAGASGMGEMDVLKVMVEQLGALPGRKTVLMLSTGLQLPPEQLEVFRNLVGTANRYNVSIYGVDVNGLTTYNPMWASTALIGQSIGLSNAQAADDLSSGQMHQDDVTEYGLRAANRQEALGELSENTGGFLIANTNDPRKAMAHIMEDVNTHYEVTYSPKSEIFDGHFRKIEAKLLRAGLHVQSRSGYYAVPDINGKPVESYEVAALSALNARPLPKDIEYRVSAQHFRPGPDGWQESMTFELPTAGLLATALENPPANEFIQPFSRLLRTTPDKL
jgi:VWFA-related protein